MYSTICNFNVIHHAHRLQIIDNRFRIGASTSTSSCLFLDLILVSYILIVVRTTHTLSTAAMGTAVTFDSHVPGTIGQ